MLTPHLKPRPAQASLVLAGLLAALFILPGTNAQEGTSYNVSNQESAIARKNRAAQEAEEKVSLSADKIVEILRDEPGLLLQVKKLLVMKAYEQGRILDPKDLTDEALFRLLREDDNIRVLATREIEDRYYVRVKPSREEIERENELDARRGVTRTSQSNVPDQTAQSKSKTNQEDTYWSKHANQSGDYSVPNAPADPYSQPQSYPTNPQTPEPLERHAFSLERTRRRPPEGHVLVVSGGIASPWPVDPTTGRGTRLHPRRGLPDGGSDERDALPPRTGIRAGAWD